MSSLVGALKQFWCIEDKPRLYKRNTYFKDHQVSRKSANRFWISFTIVAIAMVFFWSVMGLMV